MNKVDRPAPASARWSTRSTRLFLDLDADESQIEFPIVCSTRGRAAGLDPDDLADDLRPLFDVLLERIPAPSYEEGHPLQAHVTNLDASPYVGRLALCRVREDDPQRPADRVVPRGRADRAREGDGLRT